MPGCFVTLFLAVTVLLCLFCASPARAAADITTGLVGYWRLDETNGPFADDIGGNSATEVNNTAAVAGQSGGGQVCDNGNNASITAPAQQTYRDLRTLTVSFWTRLDDYGGFSGWLEIVGLLQVRNNYGTGRLEFHADAWDNQTGSWRASSDSQLPQGQWAHVAMTYDYNQPVGTPPVIYINGQPVGYTTPFVPTGSITPPADGTLRICGVDNAGIRELKGAIDDVRIYDRVLTQEDVTELYRSWDGNIDFNTDARVPEYYNGDQWVTMGPNPYVPNAVNFDGSTTSLGRGAALTGVTDTKKMTVSFWAKSDGSGTQRILYTTDPSVRVNLYAFLGTLKIVAENSSGTTILDMYLGSAFTDRAWHHYLFSFDLGVPGSMRRYVDGVAYSGTTFTFTDDLIDLSSHTNAFVGGSGSNWLDGDVADFWVDFDNYIDFSVEANRRKFINSRGEPVYLGPDGSLPTGTAPEIFLSGDTATWHTNDGTGGGFIENGALTDALTTPMNVDVTSGLVGHWKLDEGSGTTAADSSGNGNDGTMLGGLSGTDSEVGVISNALHFDGVDDGIEIADNAALQPASAFTLSVWVKMDLSITDTNVVIAKQVGTTYRNSYTITLDGATQTLNGYSGNSGNLIGLSADFLPAPGVWYHIVYTFDDAANNHKLYIDGAEVASGSNNQALEYSAAPVTIGYDYEDNTYTTREFPFDGLIDDVRIYDRALSVSEINALYNKTSVCLGPAGYGGKIIYNADGHVLQYCDGANWRAMGQSDYPFAAAEYCDGLSAYGYRDWYLPAQDELNVLYTNKNIGGLDGTFNETGAFPVGRYWSSSEISSGNGRFQNFSNGTQVGGGKNFVSAVRCVRKD